MKFYPTKGIVVTDLTRAHLKCIIIYDVVFYLYAQLRQSLPFEHINVYSVWLIYEIHIVRYLPVRVMPQFGYVQTILKHPYPYDSPTMTR